VADMLRFSCHLFPLRNVHAVEREQSANGVPTPMDPVEKRPVPSRIVDLSSVEGDKSPSDVVVDVQQVIANIAHARFVGKRRDRQQRGGGACLGNEAGGAGHRLHHLAGGDAGGEGHTANGYPSATSVGCSALAPTQPRLALQRSHLL